MAQQYPYAQPNGHNPGAPPPFALASQSPSLFSNGMLPTSMAPGSMVPSNLTGAFPRPGSSGGPPRRAGGLTLEEAQAQYRRQTAEANSGPHLLQRQNPTSFTNSLASTSAPTPARPVSIPVVRPPPTLTEPTDGGPPFNVPLHNLFTRQTPLAPGVPFPAIDSADQVRVKRWMDRDKEYEASFMSAKRSAKTRLEKLGDELFRSGDWLGEDGPKARTKVKMEPERARDREKGKRGPNRKELKLTKQQMRAIAALPEVLIPIRLEYEHESYKLRDTFTWNLRDTMVTPEIFASHLCDDLRLPLHPFYKEIVSQIKKHLEEAHLIEEYDAHLGDDLASVRDENRAWFETNSKRRKLGEELKDDEMEVDPNEEKVLLPRDFSGQEGQNDELRVLIKLDITLDSIQLVDKFEWDISDPRNSPEDFADTFAADLGLAGEFRTAIAHSIREQVDVFVKSLCLLGHVNGLAIPDDDLRREFLPSLFEPFRSAVEDFTPLLNQLTPDEVERNDKEREREVRRKRRQTKGRGVTLPDRDHVKTHRTLVPKPSTVPIHSYQDSRGDMVYPMPEYSEPYPIVAPVVPPKPAHLNVTTASPLKLVPAKNTISGPPTPAADALRAGGSRLKRGRQDGSTASLEGMGEASTSRATSPRSKPVVKKSKLEALGLHEHMINGAWHCANCGVPESCSPGRRKGPSGSASLCSDCGKFYHRLRRNKPCVYTTDLATHLAARAETLKASKPPKDLGRGSSRRAEAPTPSSSHPLSRVKDGLRASSEERDSDEDNSGSSGSEDDGRGRRGVSPDLPFVNVGSPGTDNSSRLSSVSPPPAAAALPTFAPPQSAGASQDAQAMSQSQSQSQAASQPPPSIEPLPWMVAAAADLRSKQTDDHFEIIPRPRPPDPNVQEWRIRCLDCPGKLYNLGPGETLENFSVHFKNRVHRSNVEIRLRGSMA